MSTTIAPLGHAAGHASEVPTGGSRSVDSNRANASTASSGLLKSLVQELTQDGNLSRSDTNLMNLFVKLLQESAPAPHASAGATAPTAGGPAAPVVTPASVPAAATSNSTNAPASATTNAGDSNWLKALMSQARSDGGITDNESSAISNAIDALKGAAPALSAGDARQMLVNVMKETQADGKFSDQDLALFKKIAPFSKEQTSAGNNAVSAPDTKAAQLANTKAQPASSNASARMENGRAVFENDNYRITANDDNEVSIANKRTGENYRAWGDPHMDIDGKHEFDFWGTTSLALDDGTKVTIETTPWKNDLTQTLSSKVTITNGDYGVQFTGVDSNTSGDLKLEESRGGGATLDKNVADGNVLFENRNGKGFVAADGKGQVRATDRAFMDETDLLKNGKAGGQVGAGEQVKRTLAVMLQDGALTGEESKQIESIIQGLGIGSIDNALGRGMLNEMIKGAFATDRGMDRGEADAFDALSAIVQGETISSKSLTEGITSQYMAAYLMSPFMGANDLGSIISGLGAQTQEKKTSESQKG